VKEPVQWCGALKCNIDFETESALKVEVLTMDSGKPRMERSDTFTINVEDVNDPPTNIKINLDLVKENEPAKTVIGNSI